MHTTHSLAHRQATLDDLPAIISLLHDDPLGQTREQHNPHSQISPRYIDAFQKISSDPNQYLMVVESTTDPQSPQIIGTCHLTLIPSLTFTGSTRLQIEAVRVASQNRGQKIGEWIIQQAITFAQKNNATIIQLTTNKERPRALKFYESLGFIPSHQGLKLYLNNFS